MGAAPPTTSSTAPLSRSAPRARSRAPARARARSRSAVPVTGLQPVTVYYYRLVAVNSAGAAMGPERTFLTAKVPLSLQISVSPSPVQYGGTVTVQGSLSGTESANREVVLLADPFPFSGGLSGHREPGADERERQLPVPAAGLDRNDQVRGDDDAPTRPSSARSQSRTSPWWSRATSPAPGASITRASTGP